MNKLDPLNPIPNLPEAPKAIVEEIEAVSDTHEHFEDLDPLLPLGELVHSLTNTEKQRVDPETGQVLTVEQIKVEMPIELRVSVNESGQVALKGAAPTQRTATTVLPVFHRMQLRIVEDRSLENHHDVEDLSLEDLSGEDRHDQ